MRPSRQLQAQPAQPRVRRGAAVPETPAVSIIVLVTASTDRLLQCLPSITAGAQTGPAAEILVLANGTVPTALTALAGREDIVLIRSAVNHGFGGGCNWAARFARGARLVFINDDAVAAPGWLEALDGAMNDDPRTAVVGSRVLLRDGRLQEAGNVIWRDGSTSHVGRLMSADESRFLRRRDVDYVSFCSAMIRREAWDGVGGFDERYFPAYYEDADLCLSLRAMGWRVVCEPESVVIHEEGASTPVHLRHFLSRRNQQRFVAKWGSTLDSFAERPSAANAGAMMEDALQRHAVSAGRAAVPTPSLGRSESMPRNPAEDDEVEARVVELRHLNDDLALKDDYIKALTTELDGYGAISLARKRYSAIRHLVGRHVRRHARWSRLADLVLNRLGRRR
jgi:GT2 family glycosyltransferase